MFEYIQQRLALKEGRVTYCTRSAALTSQECLSNGRFPGGADRERQGLTASEEASNHGRESATSRGVPLSVDTSRKTEEGIWPACLAPPRRFTELLSQPRGHVATAAVSMLELVAGGGREAREPTRSIARAACLCARSAVGGWK